MAVNSARQDELQKEVPKKDTLIRMFRYLLDYKRTIAFVSVLILIALAATLAGPLMIERAVDVYVANSDIPGLARLAAHYGIEREEVMAFGDHWNDAEMLEWAGESFAMENAIPEIRARAKHIAPSNAEDGVARTIEEFLLR